ncbi:hypothetical protein Ancab_018184 [Ancistrocladus abbreviatus]
MPVASSPMEKLITVESQTAKCFEVPDSYLMQEQKGNLTFPRDAVGANRAASHSLNLWDSAGHETGAISNLNAQSTLFLKDRSRDTHYENGLFSSSLSELFSRKLRLPPNNDLYGHSVDTVASHYEDEDPFESLEEIEAQTIGNLLPNDDDLLSGVIDRLEQAAQPGAGDDIEDLDLFSSVGGMDLGDDNSFGEQRNTEISGGISAGRLLGGSNVSIAGEHPYGEHQSRTLFVRNINSNVEDSELRAVFEHYGDIRTLYTACKHRGFVMISYYDIRAAQNAMNALQNKPLRHRKLDIHYSIPKDNPSDKDVNQGTLVVFNLDSSVSDDNLHQIFGVYGEIKEIRETPHQSNQKFVEFYDVRAAEAALHALNQSDIAGKRIMLEPSRLGGARKSSTQQLSLELEQDEAGLYMQQSSPASAPSIGFSGLFLHGPIKSTSMERENSLGTHSGVQAPVAPFVENAFHQGISASVPSNLSSLLRIETVRNQPGLSKPGSSLSQVKYDFRGMATFHPHSLPEYRDGLASGTPCNSPGNVLAGIGPLSCEGVDKLYGRMSTNGCSAETGNGYGSSANESCPLLRHHYMWSNSNHAQPASMMWPNSPSFTNGACTTHPPSRLLPRTPSHMLNAVLPMNNHHVGSAPSVNPSLWDRQNAYLGVSPDASGFHQAAFGSMRLSGGPLHHMEFASQNIFPRVSGNCLDLSIPSRNVGVNTHHQRCMLYSSRAQMNSLATSFEPPSERVRSRRSDSSSSQADNKKQYELDVDRILQGQDNRTTLMIKNIPNKYTSKMLMAAIDERHRGTYDFIYLPIDFKNKCNVGYAFINMVDPSHIIPFYETLNGKKWEKFNSEKVASLAYARIQGKQALIAHFQNSSLMNEDKRCRPILFHTDGPNAGDQVPFPMGVNIRNRPGKPRTSNGEDNHQGSPPNSINKEESSIGDLSSGSGKELSDAVIFS